jgi:hypothetical protein
MNNMKYIYMLINESGGEWEDIVLYDNLESATDASKKYKNKRIEIFQIKKGGGYEPIYIFIKEGLLHLENKQPEVIFNLY